MDDDVFKGLAGAGNWGAFGLPIPSLDLDGFRAHLQSRPFGQMLGAFRERPQEVDLIWMMRPGSIPFPISTTSLEVMAAVIKTGGTIALFAAPPSG